MNDKIKWLGIYLECKVQMNNRIKSIKGVEVVILTPSVLHDISHAIIRLNPKLILKELKNISEDELRTILLALKIDCFSGANPTYKFKEAKEFILKVMRGSEPTDAPSIIEFTDCFRSHGIAIGIPKEYYITESELKEGE